MSISWSQLLAGTFFHREVFFTDPVSAATLYVKLLERAHTRQDIKEVVVHSSSPSLSDAFYILVVGRE